MKLLGTRRISVDEFSEILGVSRTTLWRWERAGQIPPKRRFGPNTVGWLASDIDQWSNEKFSGDRESE